MCKVKMSCYGDTVSNRKIHEQNKFNIHMEETKLQHFLQFAKLIQKTRMLIYHDLRSDTNKIQ